MPDITIPVAAVTCRDGDPVDTRTAVVAITGGQACYIDGSNGNNFNLCDADVEASAQFYGVAVNDAAIGEYLTVARPGSVITVASSTFTVGVVYYVSATPGGWTATFADLLAGDYVTVGLLGLTTTTALVTQIISGVTK